VRTLLHENDLYLLMRKGRSVVVEMKRQNIIGDSVNIMFRQQTNDPTSRLSLVSEFTLLEWFGREGTTVLVSQGPNWPRGITAEAATCSVKHIPT
jgi:hypothetical protein